MKLYAVTIFLALASFFGFSQTKDISGKVYETGSNIPLIGVNVLVKGTIIGTSTDFDGEFILKDVPEGSTILFTYIGFKNQEIVLPNSDEELLIYMEEDAQSLDEVVIIGFGSQVKKEVTGSVSTVSAKTIEEVKPVNVGQAIQGRNAGVQVINGSGAPGTDPVFNIRGISTNGDNAPLIVLDGSIFDGSINDINPNDVESFTILKDATAAIYGILGANGVILITTKIGRKNTRTTVEYNAYAGFQEIQRTLPVLNATEYALLVNEARTNNGEAPLFTDIASLGVGTDFQDIIFESAPIFSTDFSIRGGGNKSTYRFSANYVRQDGIVGGRQSANDRITSRLNFSTDLTENLKFTSNLFYTNIKGSSVSQNGLGSVIFNALNVSPIDTVFDENGEFTLSEGTGNEVINPVAQLATTFNGFDNNSFGSVLGLNYKLNEHWSAETRLGLDYVVASGFSFLPIAFFGAGKVFNIDRNSVTENTDVFFDYNWDTFINYDNTFAEDHKIKITLGQQVSENRGEFFNATGFDVPNNDIEFADLSLVTGGLVDRNFGNGQFFVRRSALFGRVQYDYKSKYLFSFQLRRDVSSNFGPEFSAAFFPSGSAGWVVTDDFFKESNALNFLKLRSSLGILGNDGPIGSGFRSPLDGEATFVFDGELRNGRATGRIPNPNIRWEQQTQFNIGADFGLWDKFNFVADYFINTTRDLILVPEVSAILGATAPGGLPPVFNGGSVRNNGFEFSVDYSDEIAKGLKLSVNYNFTTINNEVLSVDSENGFLTGGSFGIGQDPPSRFEPGFVAGYFRGLQTDGIFQNQAEVDAAATQANAAPGEFRFVDQNNDGVIDELDRTNLGDPIPDVVTGLNIRLDYKGFDLSAYAFAQIGNEIVRNFERNEPLTNRSTSFLNRFTGEGSTNSFPRATTGPTSSFLFSDFFVEDGSFLRIQTLQLGYTFPKSWIEKIYLSKLRVYGQVNNLVTFTNYSGFDPTVATTAPVGGGIDTGVFPVPRTVIFGVNVNF